MERLNDVNECRMKFGLSSVFHEMTKSEYELCLCYQFLLTASSFLYSIQKKKTNIGNKPKYCWEYNDGARCSNGYAPGYTNSPRTSENRGHGSTACCHQQSAYGRREARQFRGKIPTEIFSSRTTELLTKIVFFSLSLSLSLSF